MNVNSFKQHDDNQPFDAFDSRIGRVAEAIASKAAESNSINRVIQAAVVLQLAERQSLTKETALAVAHSKPGPRNQKRNRRIWSLCGVATGVAIIVTLTWLSIGSSNTFAQVQAALSRIRSVQFRVLDYHGDDPPFVSSSVIVSGLGARGMGPDGLESITNLRERKKISIDHKSKSATVYDLYVPEQKEAKSEEFFRLITRLAAKEFKWLGRADFNGKPVDQYELQMDGTFIVSVDPQSQLPVHMVLDMENGLGGGKKFREVITDFEYDLPIDENRFAIVVPDGYREERVASAKDRQPIDMAKIVVSAKTGFGKLALGNSLDQVIAELGQPDSIHEQKIPRHILENPPNGQELPKVVEPADRLDLVVITTRLAYPSLGFELQVGRNGLENIRCYGRQRMGDMATDFLGGTDKGTRLGDTIDKVIQAYGPPEVRTKGRAEMLHYPHSGISFLFLENLLAEISIREPLPEETIVHDNGDGTWTESAKGVKIDDSLWEKQPAAKNR